MTKPVPAAPPLSGPPSVVIATTAGSTLAMMPATSRLPEIVSDGRVIVLAGCSTTRVVEPLLSSVATKTPVATSAPTSPPASAPMSSWRVRPLRDPFVTSATGSAGWFAGGHCAIAGSGAGGGEGGAGGGAAANGAPAVGAARGRALGRGDAGRRLVHHDLGGVDAVVRIRRLVGGLVRHVSSWGMERREER